MLFLFLVDQAGLFVQIITLRTVKETLKNYAMDYNFLKRSYFGILTDEGEVRMKECTNRETS